ncbi:MAG TPA: hypothetical protein PKM22_15105 [Candidatus Hydrogenedentes bacterium]|nr:hypothetical protein [Candidatus Hydrogenedentota bacterium]
MLGVYPGPFHFQSVAKPFVYNPVQTLVIVRPHFLGNTIAFSVHQRSAALFHQSIPRLDFTQIRDSGPLQVIARYCFRPKREPIFFRRLGLLIPLLELLVLQAGEQLASSLNGPGGVDIIAIADLRGLSRIVFVAFTAHPQGNHHALLNAC